MKMCLVLALAAIALTVPLGAAHNPADGSAEGVFSTRDPEDLQEAASYRCPVPDALNLVDKTCSQNDVCAGAEDWPVRASGLSSGNVGGSGDPADWSRVEVYRTETLIAAAPAGFRVHQGGVTCTPTMEASFYAVENGWYALRVTSDAQAAYTIRYEVTADDALSGKDVGNTVGDAWFINALPKSNDPTQTIIYKGSLPNREGQPLGPDQDWYRIGSSLALAQTPTSSEGPSIGLLTVEFRPDCNGGTYLFGFYEKDGVTPIGTPLTGCGALAASCITTGTTPVHARLAVTEDRGTGYDLTAELVPLYLVDLNDGLPRSYLYPDQPWCDALVQAALDDAHGWQEDAKPGLVNPEGVVVARFPAR